jgi:hypothetical protein
MSVTKNYHLAQLRKLRDELYAKLPPQEQRRIDEARRARLEWQAWRSKQQCLPLSHQ